MLYPETLTSFLGRVHEGRVCLGVHSSSMSSQLVELYGLAGLDFVIIGTEVESLDNGRLEDLLRAAQVSRTLPIVKVKRPDPWLVSEMLNYGAPMVMVPHVTSGPQLEELVAASRFEPVGTRGECPAGRYMGYGILSPEVTAKAAHSHSLVIPIIEDKAALDNLDEIVAVEGVDIIEVGPYDLSRSLGENGLAYGSKVTLEALDAICEAARRHGKVVCAPIWHSPDSDTARKTVEWQIENMIARGVTLLYDIEVILVAQHFQRITALRSVRVRRDDEVADEAPAPSRSKRTAPKKAPPTPARKRRRA